MKIIFYPNNKPNESISFEIPYTVISDSFLDEELDVSPIEIKHTNVRDPFPRFCVASLHVTENAKPQYWMVASDDVRTNLATGLSDHTVQLVEPTKWLERFMVGNKTVTQPIYNDYLADPVVLPEKGSRDQWENRFFYAAEMELLGVKPGEYFETKLLDTPYFSPTNIDVGIGIRYPLDLVTAYNKGDQREIDIGMFINNATNIQMHVEVFRHGSSVYEKDFSWEKYVSEMSENDYVEVYEPKESDIYELCYSIRYINGSIGVRFHFGTYEIVLLKKHSVKNYTLADAAMSMIKAAEILKDNNGSPIPRFRLNEDVATELAAIVSPEITVTNATLRESLDEVGKYIGAITRLDVIPKEDAFDFEVNFEKYCKNTTADVSELGEPFEMFASAGCEDYCTALDATVDNLVQYSDGGSIYDPSSQLFRTLRSEDSSYRVTEGSAKISTAFPIERLDELWLRMYEESGDYEENDISKYVFEEHEYSALSSYKTVFPESKAYALCYTIGQKNITGLNFTCPSAVHSIFEYPAIINIINKEFKKTYNNTNNLLDFTDLLFRVKYVPTGAARVRMHKPSSFGMIPSTLAYNQGASKLDSKAFGRAMFGAALRMGNVQTTYKYVAPIDAKVPSKGERFEKDGFLSEIREEFAPNQKTVTLTVSEGFNRLSQFVGVNKEHRIFEISERSTVDRHIVYEDFCLIGMTDHGEDLAGSLACDRMTTHIENCFLAANTIVDELTDAFAIVQGYESGGIPLRKLFLPCTRFALGNAVAFTVSFADNYGAGRRIEKTEKPEESEEKEYYSIESDVRYTDLFGRVDSMSFKICDGFTHSMEASVDAVENAAAKIVAQEETVEGANAIPEIPQVLSNSENLSLIAEGDGANRIHVDKDTREAIRTLTYQINFMEEDGIKISPGFAERVFSFKGISSLALVPLNGAVGNLTEWVSKEITCPLKEVKTHNPKRVSVSFEIPTNLQDYNAWAIVDQSETNPQNKSERRFLFGKNEPIKAGETKTIYFTFYH